MNLSDPKTFFNEIPKTLAENVEFRKKLHSFLETNPEEQQKFLKLLFLDPKIAFNSCFWTLDPRNAPGSRNLPFILRSHQERAVDVLTDCINNGKVMGINKSRDEGCTEIVCKTVALYLFQPEFIAVVGSRNKVLVDEKGDETTLMAKIDYALKTMPPWMQTYLGHVERKELQIRVPKFKSGVIGETTNENFSAGRRATMMFFDEFGRVEPRIAKSIRGSIRDVTTCIVFGSTHWYGEHHPFKQELDKRSTQVVSMPWWENPTKNYGLYKSPDYNVVEIVDVDYYLREYPKISILHSSDPFKVSELDKDLLSSGYSGETPRFVADACEQIPGDVRSPWHDQQEEDRQGDKRDFLSNVWMDPIASSDTFFNGTILKRIEGEFLHPTTYEGELVWEYDSSGRVNENIRFADGAGRKRLKWWGELKNLKPLSDHNFTIGCDLSMGSGNSNSVAAIYDVNLQEIVGTWVCPNTAPDLFMDTVVALARWCNTALINYETNGPGVNAHKRLLWNGHNRIYVQRTEEARHRKIKNKYGWTSNPQTKEALLGDLGVALSESLKTSRAKSCRICDKEILHELTCYVFYESGEIGASEDQDTTSGARKRHGDRVIAVGLALLASKYQGLGVKEETEETPTNTFKYLLEQEDRKQKTLKHEMRRYLY